jgi:hypothetical protein
MPSSYKKLGVVMKLWARKKGKFVSIADRGKISLFRRRAFRVRDFVARGVMQMESETGHSLTPT